MRVFIAACGGIIALAAILVLAYLAVRELFFTPRQKDLKTQKFHLQLWAAGIFFALLLAFYIAAMLTAPRRLNQTFMPGAFMGSLLAPIGALPQAAQLPLSFFSFLTMAQAFFLYTNNKTAAAAGLFCPFLFATILDYTLSLGAAAMLLAIVFARRQQPWLSLLYTAAGCLCTPLAAAVCLLLWPYKKAFFFSAAAAAVGTACNLFILTPCLPYQRISAWFAAGNIQGILLFFFLLLFVLSFPLLFYTVKSKLSRPETVFIWGAVFLSLCLSSFSPECLIFLFPLTTRLPKEKLLLFSAAVCGLFTACCGIFSMF